MKKTILNLLSLLILIMPLFGCTNNAQEITTSKNADLNDVYVGEYVSESEPEGELIIKKEDNQYEISMNFYGLTEINATGELKNGTLYYEGTDEYGNPIDGTIEEYGKDYPLRVEVNGDNLFDEVEFERR